LSAAPESVRAGGMVALIERKKRGGELDEAELRWICDGYLSGEIPDYQVAAWLMAVRWQGMSDAETLALTRALEGTGATLDWGGLERTAVDKHSTGGVGDKTSLILVPLMTAAGAAFVKMSGRGLGHTGGTLDKLESIPGFDVALSLDALRAQVRRIGCALVGQSPELVPGDGALYALRDVTGTVDSLPLIASSIMSKKLAAGAPVIVLDVKFGSGAFMRTIEEARTLAAIMVRIGEGAGRRVRAVLSPMEEPLGCTVGNALEIREVIDTLHGRGPRDLWELVLELGTHLMLLAGLAADEERARSRLGELRDSGAGARCFAELIRAQGGDPRVVEEPERLPSAPRVVALTAPEAGWVARVDARTVGDAALELGAGRRTKSDVLDLSVGIRLLAKTGDRVEAGAPLAELHAARVEDAERAGRALLEAYRVEAEPPPVPSATYEVVG
jgi:pyrimidine-nucleoside phosphorylase